MTGTPRTSDLMLGQAARLFAVHGYRGTSVEDIGAACGISGPALYKHFPTKAAILARLLIDISEQLLEGGRAVVSNTPDPRNALDGLIQFHTDFALNEPDLIRIQDRDLTALADTPGRQVRHLQRAYVELWVDTLRQLDPTLNAERARTRAHAIFGLLNSTPHSARNRNSARRELIAMATRALNDVSS